MLRTYHIKASIVMNIRGEGLFGLLKLPIKQITARDETEREMSYTFPVEARTRLQARLILRRSFNDILEDSSLEDMFDPGLAYPLLSNILTIIRSKPYLRIKSVVRYPLTFIS